MVKMKVAVAILGLIVSVAAVPTASATISDSDTQNFSFPLSPGDETLSFAQFDDHGGLCDLEKVILELFAEETADITGENDSAIAGQMTVVLTAFVTGSGGGLTATALISQSAGPASVAASDGVPDSGPDFHDFGTLVGTGSDSQSLTSGLAPFIGAGTIDIVIHGEGGFVISGVTDSTLKVSDFGALGHATLTYEYSCIPEPATMLLAGVGLFALVLRLRKKR
jgi:hypothetical protein